MEPTSLLLLTLLLNVVLAVILLPLPTTGRSLDKQHRYSFSFFAMAATGASLGFSALIFFWSKVLAPAYPLSWIGFEIAAIFTIGIALRYSAEEKPFLWGRLLSWRSRRAQTSSVAAFGFIAILFIAFGLLSRALTNPDGYWDAWAIWNLKAKFLSSEGGHFYSLFSTLLGWTHPDYPLLLPGIVARWWSALSLQTNIVPVLTGSAFSIGVLICSYSLVLKLRSFGAALLSVFLLIGNPHFISLSTYQYADIPVAFYLLACCGVYMFWRERLSASADTLLLLGVLLGCLLWTKNEGMIISGIFYLLILSDLFLLRPIARPMAASTRILVGLTPFLLSLLAFKLIYAPANDLAAGASDRLMTQLFSSSRWQQVVTAFASHYTSLLQTLGLPLALLTATFTVLFKKGVTERVKSCLVPFFLLILMHVVYAGVYVLTPHDLSWHLATSLDRLMLQVWPLWVLTYVFVFTPEGGLSQFIPITVRESFFDWSTVVKWKAAALAISLLWMSATTLSPNAQLLVEGLSLPEQIKTRYEVSSGNLKPGRSGEYFNWLKQFSPLLEGEKIVGFVSDAKSIAWYYGAQNALIPTIVVPIDNPEWKSQVKEGEGLSGSLAPQKVVAVLQDPTTLKVILQRNQLVIHTKLHERLYLLQPGNAATARSH